MDSHALSELLDSIVLQVNAVTVALAAEAIERFVLIREVRWVPGSPRELRGVTCVDGEPVLVIDLSEIVGLAKDEAQESQETATAAELGALCHHDNEPLVLIGGQVRTTGRLRIVPGSIAPLPPLSEQAVEWRGAVVPLLSLSRVLSALTTDGNGGAR